MAGLGGHRGVTGVGWTGWGPRWRRPGWGGRGGVDGVGAEVAVTGVGWTGWRPVDSQQPAHPQLMPARPAV